MANPFNLTVGSSVVVVRAKRNKRYYTEDELIVCSVETVGRASILPSRVLPTGRASARKTCARTTLT